MAAALRQAFIQPDRAGAAQALRHVADQLRRKCRKFGSFIATARSTSWRTWTFPASTEPEAIRPIPFKRLNEEVKRRADVIGIVPNEGSIIRLIGAVLLAAKDEWQTQNRYMQTKPVAKLMATTTKQETIQIPTAAA